MNMQSFRNLKVWEKAHILTLDVHKSSNGFPRDELYGLDESDAKVIDFNWHKHRRGMLSKR